MCIYIYINVYIYIYINVYIYIYINVYIYIYICVCERERESVWSYIHIYTHIMRTRFSQFNVIKNYKNNALVVVPGTKVLQTGQN